MLYLFSAALMLVGALRPDSSGEFSGRGPESNAGYVGDMSDSSFVPEHPVVKVPEGSYHSVFPEAPGEAVHVESFLMDKWPVTNRQFQAFLVDQPDWQRSRTPELFASRDYLRHWTSDDEPGEQGASQGDQPVTHVSWFAADAYCQAQGGRLPTMDEWEFAAMDLSDEELESLGQELTGWYSVMNVQAPGVVGSSGIVTRHGIEDMHKLVIEWVEDFKPPLADGLSMDCGTAGRLQSGGSAYMYARVIRTLTRMSFEPQTAVASTGFRCAYDE